MLSIAEQKRYLEKIGKDDQHYRKLFDGEFDQTNKLELGQLMEIQDRVNLEKIRSYLTIYGWPSLTAHGKSAATAVFLVVQHASLPDIEKYYPLLRQQVEKSEAEKIHAAMMEDRLLMYQNKPQKYGSQCRKRQDKFYIWPINDAINVNQRRHNEGFIETIEIYAANINALYNPALSIDDFFKILV